MTIGNVPMSRGALIERLVEVIQAVERPHPIRVAIDGPDAAGKTTLADELAAELRYLDRVVIRASIDGFHRPRAERYRQGEDSPEGYYEDSFDYESLHRVLFDPLGPDGSREYLVAVFDFRTDAARSTAVRVAADDAILLFDGVFLLRAELFASWDLRIFVSVAPHETLLRALNRDAALFGSREEVERRYSKRYIPGQELYLAAARPLEKADLVVENSDFLKPILHIQAAAPFRPPR